MDAQPPYPHIRSSLRSPRWRRWSGGMAFLLFAGAFGAVVADDFHLRHEGPRESAAARQYIEGAVHNDPARMWQTYSSLARHERGDNRDAFISYMLAGTHPVQGAPNGYRLLASLPLDTGQTLLFYQVDNMTSRGIQQTIFPVLLDERGRVDGAGDDGIRFTPPINAH